MQDFCFLDLSKEKLCGILIFGNVRFLKVVGINHDNVASRGAVGCTHTIVRFPQRDFALWVFMYPINISPFRVYSVTIYIARAITPRATTPLPPLNGYHACVYISRLPRHRSLFYS